MADFEHGDNVRGGSAIVEPKASRCCVHKAAREASVAGVLSREFAGQPGRFNARPKGGENRAGFVALSGGFTYGLQHGFAFADDRSSAR